MAGARLGQKHEAGRRPLRLTTDAADTRAAVIQQLRLILTVELFEPADLRI